MGDMTEHEHGSTRHVIQHLCAENDNNGNPRRCYVVYTIPDDGQPEINDVFDEGYGGYRGVPEWARSLPSLPSITITVGEYREWMDREEHLHGKYEVVESGSPGSREFEGEPAIPKRDEFVWHRFNTRARALRFRRERGKGQTWQIRERETVPDRGIGR
jgi:hypothetical protein